MKKRKTFSKKTRQAVFDRYRGHCAYCGCKFTSIREMQIDHIKSRLVSRFRGEPVDDSIANLMPACRQCNFYKSAKGIEGFRKALRDTLSRTCRQSFQVRLAMKYGMLEYKDWNGEFYFENFDSVEADNK